MRHHGRTLAIVSVLTLVGALPAPATFAQEPATCAPLVATSTTAMAGGNAALAAAQPGPGPGAVPITCWTVAIGRPLTSAALMTLDEAAYTADDAGNVIAFDAASGTERWRYAVVSGDGGGQARGIAPGEGMIYAAGADGLVAIEVADGSRAWRYRVKSGGTLVDANGFFWPVAAGDAVYGVTSTTQDDASYRRSVVAVDAATGDERWTKPLPDDATFGAPTSDGKLVILAPGDGSLVALDAATGSTVWTAVLDAAPVTRTAIGDGVAYVGLGGGIVVALSTTDGSEKWRTTLDSGAVAAVTAVGDAVYVDGVQTLYALDATTGAVRWPFAVQQGSPPFSFSVIPSVTADSVYVGTTDLDVLRIDALDPRTGLPRWQLETAMYGAALATVASGGRLFVVAYDILGSGGLLVLGDPAT